MEQFLFIGDNFHFQNKVTPIPASGLLLATICLDKEALTP